MRDQRNSPILTEAHQGRRKWGFLVSLFLCFFSFPFFVGRLCRVQLLFVVDDLRAHCRRYELPLCSILEKKRTYRLLICSYVSRNKRLFRLTSTCVASISALRKDTLSPVSLLLAYVPSVAAPRGVYRSAYARPTGRYGARPVGPVVPAGRGPGGAGLLAAILGPIGGLTGCLCCLNTIGVWGLFITAIPLTVYISKFIELSARTRLMSPCQGRWVRDYKNRFGLNGAEELVAPHLLLLLVLVCSFLFSFMRRH